MAGETAMTVEDLVPLLEQLQHEVSTMAKAWGRALDAVRAELVEEAKEVRATVNKPLDPAIQGTLHAVLCKLDEHDDGTLRGDLQDCADRLAQWRPPGQQPWYTWPASLAVAALLGCGISWGLMRHLGECREDIQRGALLMQQVDGVLGQQWQGLPTGVQQALTQAYRKAEVQVPGQKKGK